LGGAIEGFGRLFCAYYFVDFPVSEMTLKLSCQQATLLVEQRADVRLPAVQAAALALHLWYCPHCKRYAAQSRLVGQLALFGGRRAAADTDVQLPPAARGRIQQRVEARLKGEK
jgi:hypothetical protein